MKKYHHALNVFIVDDEKIWRRMIEHTVGLNPDYTSSVFENGTDLVARLHEEPDVVLLDYSMPEMNGMELFKKIRSINQQIEIIVISAQDDINTAIEFMHLGAYTYLTKDEGFKEKLLDHLLKIAKHRSLERQVEQLQIQVTRKYDFSKFLVGKDEAIRKIFNLIEKACKTNITVSITGETGTGKEMVAKSIHYNSDRQKRSFVAVNVAAIPRDLIESELFGYERGAFTGANARKIGKFEDAHGGTIFLDEIGEMDINLQAKLLRVVQEREITRIGGNEVIPVNVRIVVATHKNLLEEVKQKTFREDLYYRLMGLPIHLPPLRERGNDVILLALHFVEYFTKENGMPRKSLSPDAQQKLLRHPFPGNVRELKSVMELACVMSDESPVIEVEHITLHNTSTIDDLMQQERSLREYTIQIIQYFLDKYDHDVLAVAKKLDIGKSTIYRMIQAGEVKTK